MVRDQLSSLDVRRLVHEFQALVGARAKKAYHPHHEQVVLRLNPPKMRTVDLIIVRGQRVYLSRRDRPMPMQPSPFAMVLRKHLANARLVGVGQHGFDRILWLDLATAVGSRRLVIECFRDGNVILLDEAGTIIHPLTHARYADRTLLRGEPYQWPPEHADPATMGVEALLEVTSTSDRQLSRTLAGRTGLSGPLANALCAAVGLDGNRPAIELDEAGAGALLRALGEWLVRASSDPEGEVSAWYLFGSVEDREMVRGLEEAEREVALAERVEEVTPRPLTSDEAERALEAGSLAWAIDGWLGQHDATALARKEAEQLAKSQGAEGHHPSDTADSLARRLAGQQRALERFESEAAELQGIALAIEGAWDHVEALLAQTRQAVGSLGWDGVTARLRDQAWIVRVEAVDRTIVAHLPDEGGAPHGPQVELHIDESVHRNAARYHSSARKLKDKAAGARTAIADTEVGRHRQAKQARKATERGLLVGQPRARRLWFERYRWALLSGGHLLIGGRDARGNDTLVRKHLAAHDRYVHADLHGAPSCSLRLRDGLVLDEHPPVPPPAGVTALRLVQDLSGDQPSDQATQEAAQLALAWSRAWGSGAGGGQAYWVRPSQVSKQAGSGEALARGAFIVRGQRTWFHGMPMELAVAPVLIQGTPLLLSGTREVIEGLGQRWALITPGRTKKEQIANRIAKATGIPTDDILGVLPGPCELTEDHGLIDPPDDRAGGGGDEEN